MNENKIQYQNSSCVFEEDDSHTSPTGRSEQPEKPKIVKKKIIVKKMVPKKTENSSNSVIVKQIVKPKEIESKQEPKQESIIKNEEYALDLDDVSGVIIDQSSNSIDDKDEQIENPDINKKNLIKILETMKKDNMEIEYKVVTGVSNLNNKDEIIAKYELLYKNYRIENYKNIEKLLQLLKQEKTKPEPITREWTPSDKLLYNKIKDYRNSKAQSLNNIPQYCIFSNKNLDTIINVLPKTKEELEKILGPVRCSKYGDDVLAILSGA